MYMAFLTIMSLSDKIDFLLNHHFDFYLVLFYGLNKQYKTCKLMSVYALMGRFYYLQTEPG